MSRQAVAWAQLELYECTCYGGGYLHHCPSVGVFVCVFVCIGVACWGLALGAGVVIAAWPVHVLACLLGRHLRVSN
eukprot:15462997-Alexandrium_andersonii.AAC.1